MFAIEEIKKGEKVVIQGGEYTDSVGAQRANQDGKLVLHLDENLYSVENTGDDPSYYMNHSCDPNVWMDDAVTLSARRDIPVGTELTADYAMWEGEEYVSPWVCRCGSADCRMRITGHDWKDVRLRERYRNHFSPLINKWIEQSRKSV